MEFKEKLSERKNGRIQEGDVVKRTADGLVGKVIRIFPERDTLHFVDSDDKKHAAALGDVELIAEKLVGGFVDKLVEQGSKVSKRLMKEKEEKEVEEFETV